MICQDCNEQIKSVEKQARTSQGIYHYNCLYPVREEKSTECQCLNCQKMKRETADFEKWIEEKADAENS